MLWWIPLWFVAGAMTLVFLLGKCFFLAPWRVGWVVFFCNTFYDTLYKKYRWERWYVEPAAFVLIVAGWLLVAGPWVALAVSTVLAVAWGWTLYIDLHWRGGEMARQDRRYARTVPLPLPKLVLMVRGPILDRGKINLLGDWPVGHQAEFELLVLNPSLVRPQFPMKIEVAANGPGIEVLDAPMGDLRTPEPGDFVTHKFSLKAARAGGPCDVLVSLTHGDYCREERLRLRSAFAPEGKPAVQAQIRRWKGGAKAAFGWRGDHDIYDPSTFQDAVGLRMAFGLARRFAIPSTVYLSGRLSLVPEEHGKHSEHFGWDRRTQEIPDFIRFLREEVHIQAEMDFPFRCDKLYAEIGNHMYLHYGTHAACADGNKWKMRATIGDGRFDWQGPETDEFHEQKDNCALCNKVFQEKLGFMPTSFAVPGRDYSASTAAAVEAAGIRVGSDSDASQWLNVMGLPAPHHPKGTERLVDITKKYPGDCNNAYKIAVLKYWMHAARRAGSHFLYMAHQHMLRYFDNACYHLTEEMFRYVLDDCHGDFHVATVSAIGLYWERVLCPEHRCVRITHDGPSVTVENAGEVDLDRLPLEIELQGGKRMMTLVDVPGGGKTTVTVA